MILISQFVYSSESVTTVAKKVFSILSLISLVGILTFILSKVVLNAVKKEGMSSTASVVPSSTLVVTSALEKSPEIENQNKQPIELE
jgi:hypothetical protein